MGVTTDSLRWAKNRGWVRPVRRGVVAIGGRPPSPWEPVVAAALAAGPDAVISHHAAAVIHRFEGIASTIPELTLIHDRHVQLAGVRIHRSLFLGTEDVIHRSGVVLTTPVRTLIDLAGTTSDFLLGRILDDGANRRLWTPDLVADRISERGGPRRPGCVRLRRLLAERTGEGYADSRLEQRVLRVLKGKVPDPIQHYQAVFDGRVIDMDLAWPMFRIDGEIDGYAAHLQRTDFDRDRLRANAIGAHGWRLVHWTSTMDDAAILAQVLPYFRDR